MTTEGDLLTPHDVDHLGVDGCPEGVHARSFDGVGEDEGDGPVEEGMSAYGSAIRDTCSPEQVTAIVTKANALGAAFNIGNVPKEHPIDPDVERVLRQAAIDKRELGHTRTREELIEAGVIDPRRLDLPPGM